MGKQQILFIGNDALHHYVCRGHTTYLQEEYHWDQPDLVRALTAALQAAGRNAPVLVLLDQAEQQYRKEVLPKVSVMDRTKVVDRKLAMTFPQLPYRAAFNLKPSSSHHHAGTETTTNEPTLLLAGAPQTPELTKVMQAITDSEVLFSGLALVPTEATSMINRFIKLLHERTQVIDRPRWTVLLTHQKTGGLRQIVLQDGQLALTRLTPVFIADENELGGVRDIMVREFQATLNYLARFGYMPADGIDVIVVTSELLGEALQQVNLPVTHLYTLSVSEATRLLKAGPKAAAADTLYSDGLLSALMATQRRVMPLQNASLKPLQQGRKAVLYTSRILAATIIGLVAYVGLNQMQIFEVKNKIETAENDFRILQVRYNDLAKKLNTLKYLPEMVQAVLNVRDELVKTNLNVEPTVQAIVALVDKGTMKVKKLSVDPLKVESENIGGPAPAPPLDTSVPTFPPRITVTLEVGFVSADVEQNARLTEQLATQLRSKFTQHNIRVMKIIGNLSVENTVQGLSEQVSTAELTAPAAKQNETSVIEISGVAL
ncbi:MAG TPA: hypothetical protein VGF14_02670 [Alphaproteobacteria bacterium]